ncbi:MAG: SocA family protein [bacterium]|nr:SocA family protein [bacterium]
MSLKKFNIYKFIQIASYIQSNSNSSNHMKLLKLLFFADRYHLRNYGNLLTFDNYYALKYGPVGSQSKNVLALDFDYLYNISEDEANYINDRVHKINENDLEIKEKEFSSLAKSKIEALDFSINNFGNFDRFDLANITHDYPEWKRYKQLFDGQLTNQEVIHNGDFFKNPNLNDSEFIKQFLGEDPFKEDPEYLALRKENFLETNLCC